MARRPRQNAATPRPGARTLTLVSLGAVMFAGGAYLARSLLKEGARRAGLIGGDAEHAAPDLALDTPRPGPDDRAPDAFRPDPTAPVPASEREGLRPATGPAPTLVAGQPKELERVGGAEG